ncbi:MAG: hypothetical protein FJ128_11295 [Deltaproteobacteria bacterium]|nr:hypothetical protein [Deltaproteobacteria bacterium]
MNYRDLAEHIGAVVGLLTLFAGISGVLLWRMFVRMEKKLDEIMQLCCECQREFARRFVMKDEYRIDRDALWGAVNRHSHSATGRVVR